MTLAPGSSAAAGPTAFDTSMLLHPDRLETEPLELPGLPQGAQLRALRRHDDGRLRAGLVDLPAGWRSQAALRATGVLQIFVLEGALHVGDSQLQARGFAAIPRGARLPPLHSPVATRLILILDADAQLRSIDAQRADDRSGAEPALTLIPDAMAIEPIVPVIAGRRLEGFERRVLWLDEATGADTRMLRIPGGFEGGGPGWHPVHEEIFVLEGDVAPDDTRPMRPGDYLWNPAYSVHGFHEHSRGGCLLLEWHDGLWAYNAYAGPPSQG